MAKNNYLHMKLRESREEITRLKEELEASEKAAEERDRETTGKAAEQIEREQEAARVERKRVIEQLEAAEADREKVASQLQKAEERAQRDREQHKTRTRVFVTGSVLLVGIVIATLAGAFGGGSEVIVVPTTMAPTTTPASTTVATVATTTATTTTPASTMATTVATTSPPSTSVIVPSTTTVEPARVTTSVVSPVTTTTLELTLPIDPDAEEPFEPIDEEAVLLEIYELWEVGERVQVLQIVLGMQADWTYGPATFDRHVQELIDRGLALDHLPPPPTTSTTLPPFDDQVNNLYPNQQVQDFKHPGVSDEWIFFGLAGTSVQVQMTSGHFDAYLEVFGPLGDLIAFNDDHVGTDSFVSVQLCETGAYTVQARSFGYGNEQLGYYSILLTGGDVVIDALLQKCEALADS